MHIAHGFDIRSYRAIGRWRMKAANSFAPGVERKYPMSSMFEELDYQVTPLGSLILRRRRDLANGQDIYEIKLNEDFLMSSKFTASEEALGRLGLVPLKRADLDVVVGGLGLGYTAVAALERAEIRSLLVVEAMQPVIEWHQQELLPLGKILTADSRCRLVHADFFALASSPTSGFDPETPGRRFDAILLDIDHSPFSVLHPSNAELYTAEGLQRLAQHLRPGGIFAMWSNDPEDARFTTALGQAFEESWAEPVIFDNPLMDTSVEQCVYLAQKALD